MPHSDLSTRTPDGRKACAYCGVPISHLHVTCSAHSDLPKLEPLDDRYLLTEYPRMDERA